MKKTPSVIPSSPSEVEQATKIVAEIAEAKVEEKVSEEQGH